MIKEDLRFKRTERAIRSAFLELAEKHSIESITIKEITALCECNRNTFYLHYEDKFDLIEQLCHDETELLKKNLQSLPLNKYTCQKDWYLDCARISLETIEEHWAFYVPILGQNKYPSFEVTFGRIIPDYILTTLKEHNVSLSKYNEFMIPFLSGGMTNIIRCWLLEPKKYSKELLLDNLGIVITELGSIIFH